MTAIPVDRLRHSRLRVQQMELVLHLLECGTISAAAEAMGLTQSTVTRSLQELESLLEVTLFERSHSGVSPTPQCGPVELLVREFRRNLDETAVRVRAMESGETELLRVGAEPGVPMQRLGEAVTSLLDAHPASRIALRSESRESLLAAVDRGVLDLAVIRTDLGALHRRHRCHALGQHALRLVCGTRHRLAAAPRLDVASLAAQRWLLPAEDHPITRRVELAFSQAGVSPPEHRLEALYSPSLLPLIANGELICAMDEDMLAHGLLEHQLFALPDVLKLDPVALFAIERRSLSASLPAQKLLGLLDGQHPATGSMRRRA